MREVTRIKELARAAVNYLDERHIESPATVRANLLEIEKIATDLDARTGTIDPHLKG